MLIPRDIDVWRIALDHARVPPPTPGESARAARFRTEELAQRYLKSHGALRDILARYTSAPLDFALHEKGKPYLSRVTFTGMQELGGKRFLTFQRIEIGEEIWLLDAAQIAAVRCRRRC